MIDRSEQRLAPFIKWAGGKGAIVPHLMRHVPNNLANYFEPFLGGGALFLSLCGRATQFKALLSDTNPELINAYKVIRDQHEELVGALSHLVSEYRRSLNKKDYYYEKRSIAPADPVSQAARFIFLNKTCYNGLYRVNAKGQFNVPFGRYRNPRFFDVTSLRSISKALQRTNAKPEVSDYARATENCRKGDFVYFDPPYHPTSKTSSFTDYTPGGFSERDQRKLAEIFRILTERQCRLLLSNSDTPLIHSLYSDFKIETIRVNRSINSLGGRRTGYTELIITNNSS